jgi:hypothetical protein
MILMRSRRNTGAALAESAAALILIVGIVVGGILVLVNSGVACFYKEKLCFVTIQAAQYAAALPASDGNIQAETLSFANALLPQVGLPKPSSLTATRANGFVTVNISLTGLQLVGNGSILPSVINMQDTEAASQQTQLQPTAFLWIAGLNKNAQDPTGQDPYAGNGVIPIYHQQPGTNLQGSNGGTPTRPYSFVPTYLMTYNYQNQQLFPAYAQNAQDGTNLNQTASPSFQIAHP